MTDRLGLAILVAAALLAAAIYFQPTTGRFAMDRNEFGTARLDTQTGELVHCNQGRCQVLIAEGERFPTPEDAR